MTTEQTNTPKLTRRPRSLSAQLIELRESKRTALAKLLDRQAKLSRQLEAVTAQSQSLESELDRITLAIGDARDSERVDVIVQPGNNGAPSAALVVDADGVIASSHDTVAHAVEAVEGAPVRGAAE